MNAGFCYNDVHVSAKFCRPAPQGGEAILAGDAIG